MKSRKSDSYLRVDVLSLGNSHPLLSCAGVKYRCKYVGPLRDLSPIYGQDAIPSLDIPQEKPLSKLRENNSRPTHLECEVEAKLAWRDGQLCTPFIPVNIDPPSQHLGRCFHALLCATAIRIPI